MQTYAEKKQENKTTSAANSLSKKPNRSTSPAYLIDKRPEAIAQRKLQDMANSSLQARTVVQLKANINTHFPTTAQREENLEAEESIPGEANKRKCSKIGICNPKNNDTTGTIQGVFTYGDVEGAKEMTKGAYLQIAAYVNEGAVDDFATKFGEEESHYFYEWAEDENNFEDEVLENVYEIASKDEEGLIPKAEEKAHVEARDEESTEESSVEKVEAGLKKPKNYQIVREGWEDKKAMQKHCYTYCGNTQLDLVGAAKMLGLDPPMLGHGSAEGSGGTAKDEKLYAEFKAYMEYIFQVEGITGRTTANCAKKVLKGTK